MLTVLAPLVTTFYEYPDGTLSGIAKFADSMGKVGARHVMVPTLRHISAHPIMRALLLDRLDEHEFEILFLDDDREFTAARPVAEAGSGRRVL
ncbi:hypothetical protein [Actinoplanes sp. HUAS TT8]|uniref:hypothetical protein n=1 Tax=Actinoplanes sp. HUAS TT8 TaxID=3447453 RepID=UPI003F51CF08